jgi:hypothetical protein
MDITSFSFLFDGSRPCWVVGRTPIGEKLYHRADRVIWEIAPEYEQEVIEEMKRRGVPIVNVEAGVSHRPRAEHNPSDYEGLITRVSIGDGALRDFKLDP